MQGATASNTDILDVNYLIVVNVLRMMRRMNRRHIPLGVSMGVDKPVCSLRIPCEGHHNSHLWGNYILQIRHGRNVSGSTFVVFTFEIRHGPLSYCHRQLQFVTFGDYLSPVTCQPV